jgi:transcription initiation factor TFIIE subunit alpha
MKVRLTSPLVKEFVNNHSGEHGYKIMRCLSTGKTDEQISKKTKLEVNKIRAVLNKLHYLGVITYSKVKAKKSNWYTYTWFLQRSRIDELLEDKYSDELEQIGQKLDMHDNYVFFNCGNGCNALPFELSFEYNFKCPECGSIMKEKSNGKEKTQLKRRAREIKTLIA